MEMNTRLQVEHPVTEAVTGLDLVEWQLRVARGEPLPLAQEQVRFAGHGIEVRLCAEDEDFAPHTGTVAVFVPPSPASGGSDFLPLPLGEGRGEGTTAHPSLRFDHAIYEGLRVSPYYDSMLGKLIAHAPSREEAIDILAAGLDHLRLLGLPSNRRFLAACLRHPVFRAGDAGISFLADQGDAVRTQLAAEEGACLEAAARAALAPAAGAMPCPFARPVRVRHRGQVHDWQFTADGSSLPPVAVVTMQPAQMHVQCADVDLFIDDLSHAPTARGGSAAGDEVRAPFNGKVLAVRVAPGTAVRKGEPLLVLESMKLEHTVGAPREGIVKTVHFAPGQQAATSNLLVTLEPSE
jgi:3-methylcrotonyl-CoA carboxylase alpha subunit/geranyl-CoA carboxylase alpha subunit